MKKENQKSTDKEIREKYGNIARKILEIKEEYEKRKQKRKI